LSAISPDSTPPQIGLRTASGGHMLWISSATAKAPGPGKLRLSPGPVAVFATAAAGRLPAGTYGKPWETGSAQPT